jgi:dTDP-4-dehydrorhamnose 3,5-epimerase
MYPKILKLKSFKDKRGFFYEIFNQNKYKNSIPKKFIEDDVSFSKKDVLRGFHGDHKTWKIITCIYGKIQFAYINNKKNSKYYKENKSYIFDSTELKQIIIPPSFGVAFLVLSDFALIHYKQSNYYKKNLQFEISYNSPCLNFKWKSSKPTLSQRDLAAKPLS